MAHQGRLYRHQAPRRTPRIAVILEAIHQPIPVESGFDGDGGDALLAGLEQLQDRR